MVSISLNPISVFLIKLLCDMKANNNSPKLKTTPRTQLFSCGFFRQCTQTVLSPTTSTPPPLTHAPAPPHQTPPVHARPESYSSSSSNTSQSFTQWRFPLSNSPISHYSYSHPKPEPETDTRRDISVPPPVLHANLEELFHMAEVHFNSGSDYDRLGVIQLLERSLVPDPRAAVEGGTCPVAVVRGVVESLSEEVVRKPASKVLAGALPGRGKQERCGRGGGSYCGGGGACGCRDFVGGEVIGGVGTSVHDGGWRGGGARPCFGCSDDGGGYGKDGGEGKRTCNKRYGGGLGEDAKVAPPEEVARAVMLALQGGL